MPPARRRKDTAVIRELLSRPFRYSFRQAVRLLERAAVLRPDNGVARNPVARYTPPSSEVVRFHTRQSFSFPASELSAVEERKSPVSGAHQWHLQVNFMGLSGSSGVLPYHYSELILKRLKVKDRSMQDFFDLLNHRLISLFFQASVKYQLALEYERKKLSSPAASDGDISAKVLLALIGLGTPGLNRRLHVSDESLLYYSGLFTSKVRTCAGLRQMIFHRFRVSVEIREFIGQWQDLIDDVRTRMPSVEHPRGQNNQLGKSVMIGRKGWFSQGKIQIILGPLTTQQLYAFAPRSSTLRELNELVRMYINFEHDYDIVMRIRRRDIPDTARLQKNKPPILSWNTWVSANKGQFRDKETIVDIPVSARRLL